MNAKPLPLNILALALVVIATSCNRQNVPEFAAGRFHHKEINNKHSDETVLALQQREKIEAISAKKSEGIQSASQVNEDLKPIAAPGNIKTIKRITRRRLSETPVIDRETVKPEYPKNTIYNFRKPVETHADPGDDKALCAIISIFIPFLGVGLYEGITTNFWIDLILSLFFWIPGIIFALIVILSN